VFLCPFPFRPSIQEAVEWFQDGSFGSDDAGIKVDKAEELLQLLDAGGSWCFSCGADPFRKRMDPGGVDSET